MERDVRVRAGIDLSAITLFLVLNVVLFGETTEVSQCVDIASHLSSSGYRLLLIFIHCFSDNLWQKMSVSLNKTFVKNYSKNDY